MTQLLGPIELRSQGFDALARSLGWVNAVRFIQQYESSRLNYTAERDDILPAWSAEELHKELLAIAPQGAVASRVSRPRRRSK